MTKYTAPAALADVYEKIARATARREELNSAIASISGKDLYRVETEQASDGWTVVHVKVFRQPPRALGAMFAEAALPFRSALDYLANELAVLDGGSRRTSFPIYRARNDYRRDGHGLLRGVHPVHREAIERMQPFEDERPEDHPLAQLAAITNADKHSGLLPTFVRPLEHATELTFATPVDDAETRVPESKPLRDGDELFRVRSRPPAEIRMKGRLALDLAFGEPLYTREHLEVIGAHVLWILDVFAEAWGHPRQIPDGWGAIRVGGLGPWEGRTVLRGRDADDNEAIVDLPMKLRQVDDDPDDGAVAK